MGINYIIRENFTQMNIKKNINLAALFMIMGILISSCGSDDPKPSSLIITKVTPFDVGNNFDASDIFVRTALSEAIGSPFKIFIAKATSSSEATFKNLSGLSSESYTIAEASSLRFDTKLQANQLDTDGNAIEQSVDYQIFILNEEEGVLSLPSDIVSPRDVGILSGKYRGTWDDNIYTSFGITAVISGSGNTFSGPFYYSNGLPDFTSCCGTADDGRIIVKIDGESITEFIYNQDLPTFMGGCPGLYDGTGSLKDAITLLVNFSGEDCEGPHTGGRIELERIE